MGIITDTLLAYLPSKRKTTPSGWIGFDAPCCDDKKQRGGMIINAGDAVSYHCFNCGFKCSWQPGRTISKKLRKFMRDLNVPDDTISKLNLEALRTSGTTNSEVRTIIPKFEERALPLDAVLIEDAVPNDGSEINPKLLNVLTYLGTRKLYLEDYPFYWSPHTGINSRVIIPFYKDHVVVGYTARAIGDAKPRYISDQQPGYVFNLDAQQSYTQAFTIIAEGPIDAISIKGCALMGSEIKDSQNWLLRQLGRELILVPDRDHEGPKLVEQAIEYNWSVSMPEWPDGIKDINDAVIKLGRLATLWLIVSAKESYALKIRLRAKKWFKTDVQ